ncbi:hypothetical protein ABIA45_005343 [Bradyrhizobium sp. USDA 336]
MRAGRGDIDWHFASIVVSLIWLALLSAKLLAVLLRGPALRSDPVSLNGAEWHSSGTN